ncbi:MAG: hypothetical protein Q4D90_10925, partial [bacterium]|nr:hypothetical protein [bacterium]
ESETDGEVRVTFSFVGLEGYGKDARESIFYAFAEAKCPIVQMQEKKKTLEEVFLELTEGEKQDKQKKPKKRDKVEKQEGQEEQEREKQQEIEEAETENAETGEAEILSADVEEMEEEKNESNI